MNSEFINELTRSPLVRDPGTRNTNALNAGFIYAPYIPLQVTTTDINNIKASRFGDASASCSLNKFYKTIHVAAGVKINE